MNKKTIIIIAIVIIFIAVLAIPKISFTDDNEKSTMQRGASGPVPVQVKVIKPEFLENKILANGNLISDEEIELHPETSGKIISIFFNEGERVNKGDLLVKINDADLRANLRKAEEELKLAKDKANRQNLLLEKELTSQEVFDIAQNEVSGAEADIEFIKAQIAKTEIRAPFSGTVGLRYVSEGSYVTPNINIAKLQKIDPIKIEFSVPQKYSNQVKEGQTIQFHLSSQEKEFTGKIYAIEPKIDADTRTLKLRAKAPNKNRELFPGSFVELNLVLGKTDSAKLIPTEAVVPDLQGEKVFVFNDGKAMPRNVRIGVRNEDAIQIIDGIEIGDTVIVSGIIQLRPGLPVRIDEKP